MIVHLVQYGLVACQMEMPPATWPPGHKWSSDLEQVTCTNCRTAAKELPPTFELSPNGSWIKCLICGAVSHNGNDVQNRWCNWCKINHDDIWPPARKMLIGHPEKIGGTKWPGQA